MFSSIAHSVLTLNAGFFFLTPTSSPTSLQFGLYLPGVNTGSTRRPLTFNVDHKSKLSSAFTFYSPFLSVPDNYTNLLPVSIDLPLPDIAYNVCEELALIL